MKRALIMVFGIHSKIILLRLSSHKRCLKKKLKHLYFSNKNKRKTIKKKTNGYMIKSQEILFKSPLLFISQIRQHKQKQQ